MRRFSLFLLIFIVVCNNTSYAEDQGSLQDVFWNNLRYNNGLVDFSQPSPACTSEDALCSDFSQYPHEQCWKAYWFKDASMLEWFSIEFSASVRPANYSDWNHWDCHYTEVWADYFAEMYYEGGVNNPLASDDYIAFWIDMRYEGAPVDPYSAPPNYDPELDYYAGCRGEIGYHWYWEYYFGSQHNYATGEVADLEWCGIPFDVTTCPYDYIQEEDSFPYNRMQRGYLEYWAEYFLHSKN